MAVIVALGEVLGLPGSVIAEVAVVAILVAVVIVVAVVVARGLVLVSQVLALQVSRGVIGRAGAGPKEIAQEILTIKITLTIDVGDLAETLTKRLELRR
jgi:hypothetical protein